MGLERTCNKKVGHLFLRVIGLDWRGQDLILSSSLSFRDYLRKYRTIIEARIDQRKRYQLYWGQLVVDLEPQQLDASWDALQRSQFNLAKNAEYMREYGETFRQLDEAAEEFFESDDEEQKEDESEREEKKEDTSSGEGPLLERQLAQGNEEGFERALPPLDNIKGK